MNKTKQKGFTMIEALIVFAIIAVLAAMAAPSFGRMLAKSRLNASVNEFRESFNLAMREAVQKKHNVQLCPSEDGKVCSSNVNDFSYGWIIYDKTADTVIRDVPPAVTAQSGATNPLSITLNNKEVLTFLNNGRLKPEGGSAKFVLTAQYDKKPSLTREIEISSTGNFNPVKK